MARDHVKEGLAVRGGRQGNAERGAWKTTRLKLPDRNLAILKERLYRCRTYRELADEYGITAERVRQILNRSVRLISNSEHAIASLKTRLDQLDQELRIRDRLFPPSPVQLSWQRLLDQSVEELHLSPRPRNALKRYEIVRLAELWDKPDSELLGWKNLGRKSLSELREAMIDYCASHGWTVFWKHTLDRRLGHMELERPEAAEVT